MAGQVNLIHLLSPSALWVRYGMRFPARVTAWNHVNGSALTVAPTINAIGELGGKVVAVPFWYNIHNVLLQRMLREAKLVPVVRPRDAAIAPNEVNLIVLPPAEMVSALAARSVAGFIVADPFNAAADLAGVGKALRFSGDIWKNHACCVTLLAERDLTDRPEWAQRVNTALVRELRETRIEGDNRFLDSLDPAFVARDLVDDRFVRKAIAAVGGPQAFGLPADLLRREVLT